MPSIPQRMIERAKWEIYYTKQDEKRKKEGTFHNSITEHEYKTRFNRLNRTYFSFDNNDADKLNSNIKVTKHDKVDTTTLYIYSKATDKLNFKPTPQSKVITRVNVDSTTLYIYTPHQLKISTWKTKHQYQRQPQKGLPQIKPSYPSQKYL